MKLRLLSVALVVSSLGTVSYAQKPENNPLQTPVVQQPKPAQPQNPQPALPPTNSADSPTPLTLDEALRLASLQASEFAQAGINERIAAEDVKQAQVAFLPRVSVPLDYIYTSPSLGQPPGSPRTQSFISPSAIGEYEALLSVAGEVDIAGRLRATLARNRALLAAAHAGTEVARRALAQAVIEAYFGLALALSDRQAAEQNLAAAEEFERITSLLLSGGEVAPVDLTRARLQTTARRDELEKVRAAEMIAAARLRVLVGYDFSKPVATADLAQVVPVDADIERITADMITRRPEFAQFEAERTAAEQEIRLAKAERKPQLSYALNGGFDSDSLRPERLKTHTGVSATFILSIPVFDWGASKSREQQARLRAELAESQRQFAIRSFAEQFYAARATAAAAAARIRLAAGGIALAESNLSSSIARYRSGEAQIIEVTDAQQTLVAQRQAFYQALFDYQVALAKLRQAAGQ